MHALLLFVFSSSVVFHGMPGFFVYKMCALCCGVLIECGWYRVVMVTKEILAKLVKMELKSVNSGHYLLHRCDSALFVLWI